MDLLPFQRRFVKATLSPDVDTSCLSIPRGNGKSSLVAWLAARTLTPGDDLHVPGVENYIIAASIGQARRTVFKLLREQLGDDEKTYKFAESHTSCHIFHRKTKARVSVLASGAKQAQGLVRCRWAFCDEPGSWLPVEGANMADALLTAQGKPGCDLKAIYIGTLAPALDGWWHELVGRGSRRSTYVQALQGNIKRWSEWPAIRAVNPLMARFAKSRAKLLEQRDDALGDARLRAAFQSYRINVPSLDETAVLLTVSDWESVEAREVPHRFGRPVVGLDLGRRPSMVGGCRRLAVRAGGGGSAGPRCPRYRGPGETRPAERRLPSPAGERRVDDGRWSAGSQSGRADRPHPRVGPGRDRVRQIQARRAAGHQSTGPRHPAGNQVV